MNYNSYLNDSSQMDLSSTAPSSAMGNYASYNSNPPSSQQNYSSQFWRKPQQHQQTQQQQQQQPHSTQQQGHGQGQGQQTQGQSTYTPITTAGSFSGGMMDGEMDKLKMQLKIKESQIESLESEIQRLSETVQQQSSVQMSVSLPKQVPATLNEMFFELSLKYQKAQEELENTKLRLESLVTAVTMNPSNSVTNNGRYDELEISHKILIKLENLKKENEELMRQLSFGKVKQMEMEMSLLKRDNEKKNQLNEQLQKENEELVKKLQELQK